MKHWHWREFDWRLLLERLSISSFSQTSCYFKMLNFNLSIWQWKVQQSLQRRSRQRFRIAILSSIVTFHSSPKLFEKFPSLISPKVKHIDRAINYQRRVDLSYFTFEGFFPPLVKWIDRGEGFFFRLNLLAFPFLIYFPIFPIVLKLKEEIVHEIISA